jgi:hypothetical protein
MSENHQEPLINLGDPGPELVRIPKGAKVLPRMVLSGIKITHDYTPRYWEPFVRRATIGIVLGIIAVVLSLISLLIVAGVM